MMRVDQGPHIKRRALHVSVAVAFLVSCSAQQASQSPSTAELTSGADKAGPHPQQFPGQSQAYPQPYGTEAPFALPAPTDLAGNETALDLHERELELALEPNPAVQLSEGDRCAIVCRAIQSMRRSAEHICGLAQDRCEPARERVRKAEARAKDACPGCTTPT